MNMTINNNETNMTIINNEVNMTINKEEEHQQENQEEEHQQENKEEDELVLTFDEDLDDAVVEVSNSAKLNKPSISNTVKYVEYIQVQKKYKPMYITWKNIDNFDFSKYSFFEVLESPQYVHLYFDFDSITTKEELLDVFDWLGKLIKVFGGCSIGGYSNNEELAKEIGFRHIANDKHFVSMHAIFPETMVTATDMQKIMSHTQKDGFAYEGVHKLCDHNVYKLVSKEEGKTTKQLFRHVLSDKIYAPNHKDNKANHGYLLNGTPSNRIVQVHGYEKIVTEKEWSSLFKLKEKPKKATKQRKPTTQQPHQESLTKSIGD